MTVVYKIILSTRWTKESMISTPSTNPDEVVLSMLLDCDLSMEEVVNYTVAKKNGKTVKIVGFLTDARTFWAEVV